MGRKRRHHDADDEVEDDRPREGRGRSAGSRAADAIHDLAVAMAELPEHALADLPLGDNAREALTLARRLGSKKRERTARRRQLLFLAGLLRREDPEDLEALREAVEQTETASPRELALQLVERWRARILAGGDPVIEELLAAHPDGDRQRLRQLARQAKTPKDPAKAKKASRALFAALRDTMGVT